MTAIFVSGRFGLDNGLKGAVVAVVPVAVVVVVMTMVIVLMMLMVMVMMMMTAVGLRPLRVRMRPNVVGSRLPLPRRGHLDRKIHATTNT